MNRWTTMKTNQGGNQRHMDVPTTGVLLLRGELTTDGAGVRVVDVIDLFLISCNCNSNWCFNTFYFLKK